ncbi:nuclear receptor corepressor [Striga asiatica]|uniref:Nuclear receptor corepressor n=1 Tax=Striga asiatica TaxID=4170 RepID=A0A5A7QE80_STRAF|nr:nuclear receptor corepressor [Striga asiatica]
MPPEHLPWDRRDFRKHDRSSSDRRFTGGGGGRGGFGGGDHRWREQQHHPHAPPHPPPYHHHRSNPQQQRWYSDFRSSRPIPSGHGKQGGWGMHPDEAGRGFSPFGSRYGDRNLEDDNFRPFGSRGEGRYFRNSRENRGSFSQKDWKSPSWEPPVASSGGSGKLNDDLSNQKSVENAQTCPSNSNRVNNSENAETYHHNISKGNGPENIENNSKGNNSHLPPPDSIYSQPQTVLKEKNEKDGGTRDEPASSVQKSDKENAVGSMDWKLKWNRSGNLSSRGSGLSRSSNSKSTAVGSVEKIADVQLKNTAPVDTPAAVCVEPTARAPSDDTGSRKKPRLGWGEGLAKYEKKKVDGPEDGVSKDFVANSVSTTEAMQFTSVDVLHKSPKAVDVLDCASPATPSSVGCSSSPGVSLIPDLLYTLSNLPKARLLRALGPDFRGLTLRSMSNRTNIIVLFFIEYPVSVNMKCLVKQGSLFLAMPIEASENLSVVSAIKFCGLTCIEEKESIKAVKIDHDPANVSFSPSIMSQIHCEEPTFNLENLDLASIAKLSSLINGMLQPDDPASLETGHVRATSMNKLLAWKVTVLKALEVTESEIDVLETEFKSLVTEPGSCCSQPAASSLLPRECHSNSYEQVTVSSSVKPSLQVVPSGDMIVESPPADDEDSMSDEDEDDMSDEYEDSASDEDEDLTGVGSMYFDYHHIYEDILASNKVSANRALEELNKLLPTQQFPLDVLAAASVSSLQEDTSVIKHRFLMRKRSLMFKEKVLALKFKVFQHFWREGRVVSASKLRGKSHKKLDLSRTGFKKNRSSNRSRLSYSVGSSHKVPAEEVIEFITELLRESQMKPCRSTLKMPAMILDKGIKMSRFVSNNAIVEDPCAAERERSIINPWTPDETEIFIDKLSIFGKDFSKIASFLERKTVADCVEFYYKNHKSESFQRAKPGVTKQSKSQPTTYLVANGKRWNREANAASLDVLGEASMIAANVIETQQKKCAPSRIFLGESRSQKAPPPRIFHGPLERSNSLDNNDAVAADVLAGICGSLSSGEAMGSCITSSVDPTDGYHQRVASCVKRPLTPDVTQSVDDECSDESCGEMVDFTTDWTDEEKSFFVQAVSSYGKDFAMISQCLRTRSVEQCKIFFSKARKCLGLDRVTPGPGNAAVCGGGDVDGGDGSSDPEDDCVVQIGSVTANDDSECKMEVDPPEKCSRESDMPGTSESKPDFNKTCVESSQAPIDSVVAEPVSKDLSMGDDIPVDDKQVVDFNVDSKEQSCVAGAFTPELDVKTSVVSTTIVESVRVGEGSDHGQPNGGSSDADNDNKGLSKVSNGNHMEDNEGHELIVSDDNLENRKVEDVGANSTELNVVRCTPVEVKAENVSHPSVNSHSVSQNHPLEQNGHLESMDSSTLFSVPIKYQRHPDGLPDVCANGTSQNHPQKLSVTGDCQPHISSHSLSDSVEPSHILRGYPVSVQSLKEFNGEVIKHVPTQNVPMRDGKLNLDLHADFSLRKCSTELKSQIENVPFPPPQLPMRNHHHSGPQSGCSPDLDKPQQPSKNGDVKLFGKILISSQEKKTSSCDHDVSSNHNNGHHHHHQQPLALKFSGDDNAVVNLDSFQSKVGCNSYLTSSENNNSIPFKSFSCWDENRTTQPTIFPSLPDSTLLLAKYPTAFHNHSTPTLKFDQNDHHPFFQAREMNNGLSSDYQLLINRDLQQPFTMDNNMKQSQDVLFSGMQRRNGFGLVQGLQQQQQAARSMVGGQCSSGISDPVTAIKLHYAKAQSITVQAGNVIREEDTWRSNGDVGRGKRVLLTDLVEKV